MRFVAAAFAGGALLGALAGCDTAPSQLHGVARDTGRPLADHATATPAASGTPSAPPPVVHHDLIVVVGYVAADGAGDLPLTLLRPDGTVLGTTTVPTAAEWTVAAGPGGAYWAAGGRLRRLGVDGQVTDIGAVSKELQGRVAISPDGSRWSFATWSTDSQGRVDNRLWVGTAGAAPQVLAERVADPVHPAPDVSGQWWYAISSWTADGILIVRQPIGGCGCGPFDMQMMAGSTALVNPTTGIAAALPTDRTCPLSGAGLGRMTACFHGSATQAPAADELRVTVGSTPMQHFSLSGTTMGGDARFDPSGSTLAYVTVPQSADCSNWTTQTTLRVLDLGTGTAHVVGPHGLQPEAWLHDGSIVGTLSRQGSGGDSTTSVVRVDPGSGAVHVLLAGGVERVAGLATD